MYTKERELNPEEIETCPDCGSDIDNGFCLFCEDCEKADVIHDRMKEE